MAKKPTIVTWRDVVEKSLPAGTRLGHVDVFHDIERLDYLTPEQIEETFVEVELVPTGRSVKDALKKRS